MNTRKIKQDYTKFAAQSDETEDDDEEEEADEYEVEYLDEALDETEFVQVDADDSFDLKSEEKNDYLDDDDSDEPVLKRPRGVTIRKINNTQKKSATANAIKKPRKPKDEFSDVLLSKLESIEKLLVVYANATKNKANAVKTQFGRKSFTVHKKESQPEPEQPEEEEELVPVVDDANNIEVEENRLEVEENHADYVIEEFDEAEVDLKTKYNFPLKTADEIIELNEKVRDDPDCARDVGEYFGHLRQECNADLPQILNEIATDSALVEADNPDNFNSLLVSCKLFGELFYTAMASKRLTSEKFQDDVKKELRKCKNRHMFKMAR